MADVLFKKVDYTLKKLIEDIQVGEIGLPDIQRPFVWPRSKVRDLFEYLKAEKDKLLAEKEIFLLRNLSRGHGIGFFQERGFYPDFILWIVDQTTTAQHIVFIEPHGMLHAKAYLHDEKARLHERLPALAEEIGKRSGRSNITLDAFIISATPYNDLYQHYDDGTWNRAAFARKHILFPERGPEYDYMQILLDI